MTIPAPTRPVGPNTNTNGRKATSVSDFSSPEYWSDRFSIETSFEWLLSSSQIVPLVLDHCAAPATSACPPDEEEEEGGAGDKGKMEGGWRVLHVGCGTSSLGRDVEAALREAYPCVEVEVVDSDYVADSIFPSAIIATAKTSQGKILALDCLDLVDLQAKSPGEGWDMILDKSTADAISCGPLRPYPWSAGSPGPGEEGEARGEEPLDILLRNLAQVTRVGSKWISISYSATRYSHLDSEAGAGWMVVEKRFLASTSLPEGRRVKDIRTGEERVVWEPETGVWGWVLQRV